MRPILLALASVVMLGENAIAAVPPWAPVSLLGITIGEPLSPIACDTVEDAAAHWSKMCRKEIKSSVKGMLEFSVRPEAASKATFVEEITIYTIDGNVEYILIDTNGVESQADVLRQLIDKFGRSSESGEETRQNGFGAKFQAVVASWKVADTTIRFQDISDNINAGFIEVASKKASAKYTEGETRRRASEPHL